MLWFGPLPCITSYSAEEMRTRNNEKLQKCVFNVKTSLILTSRMAVPHWLTTV